MKRTFTKHECSVILGFHRTMPVKGCHSRRGWKHSEDCYDTCFSSWQATARDVALILSFSRPELDKQAFVAACEQLPRTVTKITDRFWSR